MRRLDWAPIFIERCRRGESVNLLTEAFATTLQRLGFRFFACVSHVDPSSSASIPGAVFVHNYPDRWARFYIESQLHSIDPIFRRADRSQVPFDWHDEEMNGQLTLEQREIFAVARTHGIENGYTIPIHMPTALGIPSGSCSVIPNDRSLDQWSYFAAAVIAPYFYNAVGRATARKFGSPAPLARRERECLALVAQGKNDWTIGQLLNISEHTAHSYIESAKKRLGVSTRVQAVAVALTTGQLVPVASPPRDSLRNKDASRRFINPLFR